MTLDEYGSRLSDNCTADQFQLFVQFLTEKSLVEMFETNLADRERMEMSYAKELVANGFVWGASPEKFDFWNEVDDEWYTYLLKHENTKTKIRKRG